MDDTSKTLRRGVTFAGCVLVVVVLYWAQAVPVPIALAILLTFVLTPGVTWLERWIGRIPAVLAVVTLVFTVLGLAGWALARQMDHLAEDLPRSFDVEAGNAGVNVDADRSILAATVVNLLQNAFKFTRPGTTVTLRSSATPDRVLIEVEDECGGLPDGNVNVLFQPFEQRGADRTGLGLGLTISRWGAEANKGRIRARDLPGHGCIFIIDLPRAAVSLSATSVNQDVAHSGVMKLASPVVASCHDDQPGIGAGPKRSEGTGGWSRVASISPATRRPMSKSKRAQPREVTPARRLDRRSDTTRRIRTRNDHFRARRFGTEHHVRREGRGAAVSPFSLRKRSSRRSVGSRSLLW